MGRIYDCAWGRGVVALFWVMITEGRDESGREVLLGGL